MFNIYNINIDCNMNPCDGPENSFDGNGNPFYGNGNSSNGNQNLFDGNDNVFYRIGNSSNGNGNQFDWNGIPSLARLTQNQNNTPESPRIFCSTCVRYHKGKCWLSVCKTCGKKHKGQCWIENRTTSEYRQQFPFAENRPEGHSQASVVNGNLPLSRPIQNHTPEIQWTYCSKCKRDHRGTCWYARKESNDSPSTSTNMPISHYYDSQSSTYSDFAGENEPRRVISRSSDWSYCSRVRTGIIQSQIVPYHSSLEPRVLCKTCGKIHKGHCWYINKTTSEYKQLSPLTGNKPEEHSQASVVDENKKTKDDETPGKIDSSTDIIISDIKKKDSSASLVDTCSSELMNFYKCTETNLTGFQTSLVDKNKFDAIDSSSELMNFYKCTETNLTAFQTSLINGKNETPNTPGEIDNSTTMVNVEKNKTRESTVKINLDIVKEEYSDLFGYLKKEIPNVLQDIDYSTTPINVKNHIDTNLTRINVSHIKKEDSLALHTNVENEIHNLLVATDNSTTLIDVQEQTETFTTDNIVLNSTQTREINQNALTDSKSTKRKMDNNGEFIQKKCRIKRGPNKPECDVYDQATESPKIPDETIKSVEDQTTTKRADLLVDTGEKALNNLSQINNQTPLTNNDDTIKKKYELSDIVLKILSPYYLDKYFLNKLLFKFMAKAIVHKLMKCSNFPEKQILKNSIGNMFETYGRTIIKEDQAKECISKYFKLI